MNHENANLATVLRQKGYRMTPQRQMVLDAVCESGGHATPDEIFELIQNRSQAVNRATVYRILKFLRDIELITSTALPDGHLEYELAGKEAHHHLICSQCGADYEFADSIFACLTDKIEELFDFQIDTNHISLTGLCIDCRS